MSEQTVPAIFEDGVLKPLEAVDLTEHQRVEVTVRVPDAGGSRTAEEVLAAWESILAGLPEDEASEIERLALDRSQFSSATQ
jgi:predicted DNA-binding antitoxin AbrB/MazE fold protein